MVIFLVPATPRTSTFVVVAQQQPTRTNTQCESATVVHSNITPTNPFIDNTTSFDTIFGFQEYKSALDRNPPNVTCPLTFYYYMLAYIPSKKNVRSVWYVMTPSISGYYDFQVSISELSYGWISIVEGTSCSNTTQVIGCSDKGVYEAEKSVRGVYLYANKTYYITLFSNYEYVAKKIDLLISPTTTTRPRNDECMNATPIATSVTLPFTITSDTAAISATIQPNEIVPSCDGARRLQFQPDLNRMFGRHSIWYTYTPPITGYYNFSALLVGDISGWVVEDFPITVAVYEAATGDSTTGSRICSNITNYLQERYCTRGDTHGIDRITELIGGTLYYIQIIPDDEGRLAYSEYNSLVQLTINRTSAPPINDQCTNAAVISPTAGIQNTNVDFRFATTEVLEHPNGIDCLKNVVFDSGIWYKYDHPGCRNIIQHDICKPVAYIPYTPSIFQGNSCTTMRCVQSPSKCFIYTPEQPTTYWFFVTSSNFTVNTRSNYFTLIDSSTDKVYQPLDPLTNFGYDADDNSLDDRIYRYLTKTSLNIEAHFSSDLNVTSARITYTNPNRTRCETKYPFSVFGDINGNYRPGPISLGSHLVSAIPYTQPGCTGRPIPNRTMTHTFTVAGCDVLYWIADSFSRGYIELNSTYSSLPCSALLAGSVSCGFEPATIVMDLFNADTNTRIKGVTVRYINNINQFYFGSTIDNTTSEGVQPPLLPPSAKYIVTVIINNIRHPSQTFAIANVCTN